MIDFATRAYNQSFNIDPVIRSLLDTDRGDVPLDVADLSWALLP